MKNSSMSKYTIAAIVVIFIAFGGLIYSTQKSPTTNENTPISKEDMTSRQLVDVCTTDMATQFHIHSHLTIMANKKIVEIPKNVGIDLQKNCMSSVHTHDTNGVIHIEAPIKKDFTLSDFFYKWNKPFSKNQVLDYKADNEHRVEVFVDGRGPYSDPTTIVFADHQEIFINYYAIKEGDGPFPKDFNWDEE